MNYPSKSSWLRVKKLSSVKSAKTNWKRLQVFVPRNGTQFGGRQLHHYTLVQIVSTLKNVNELTDRMSMCFSSQYARILF